MSSTSVLSAEPSERIASKLRDHMIIFNHEKRCRRVPRKALTSEPSAEIDSIISSLTPDSHVSKDDEAKFKKGENLLGFHEESTYIITVEIGGQNISVGKRLNKHYGCRAPYDENAPCELEQHVLDKYINSDGYAWMTVDRKGT